MAKEYESVTHMDEDGNLYVELPTKKENDEDQKANVFLSALAYIVFLSALAYI